MRFNISSSKWENQLIIDAFYEKINRDAIPIVVFNFCVC